MNLFLLIAATCCFNFAAFLGDDLRLKPLRLPGAIPIHLPQNLKTKQI